MLLLSVLWRTFLHSLCVYNSYKLTISQGLHESMQENSSAGREQLNKTSTSVTGLSFNQGLKSLTDLLTLQGLADALILLRYPFESNEAKELNRKIFETIYYGALTVS